MPQSDQDPPSAPPRRNRLRRELTGILVIKFSLMLLAALTIFGASNRLHVDGKVMIQHFFGPSDR